MSKCGKDTYPTEKVYKPNRYNSSIMTKRIISFTLSEDAIKKLDRASKALGLSRSEYIDMMVKKGFHFSDEVMEITKKQQELKKKIERKKEE